jgi:hypothetical protein
MVFDRMWHSVQMTDAVRRRLVSVATSLVLAALCAPNAYATINVFSVTQNQSGGITAPLNAIGDTVTGVAICPANPTPGCDFSLSDAIVRTHDIVEYGINFNNVGTDNAVEITLNAPIGMVWDILPSTFCGSGSTINNNPSAPAGAGVTTPSVIVCKLIGAQTNASQSLPFRARVLGVPHGTTLAPTAMIKSTETPALPLATGPTNTVTAGPRFNLVKTGGNSLPLKKIVTDINGNSVDGFLIGYSVAILVDGTSGTVMGGAASTAARVGAAPLIGPLTLTDLISTLPANSALVSCTTDSLNAGLPFSTYVAGDVRTVQNSGAFSCAQTAAGNNASITWSGVNTDLNWVPTKARNGTNLPAGAYYAATAAINLVVPIASIPLGTTVAVKNCLSGFDPSGAVVSGPPNSNYFANDEPGFTGTLDNCIQNFVSNTPNGNFVKRLRAGPYTSALAGNATALGSGDGNVTPGTEFVENMRLQNLGATLLSNNQICSVWDAANND